MTGGRKRYTCAACFLSRRKRAVRVQSRKVCPRCAGYRRKQRVSEPGLSVRKMAWAIGEADRIRVATSMEGTQ